MYLHRLLWPIIEVYVKQLSPNNSRALLVSWRGDLDHFAPAYCLQNIPLPPPHEEEEHESTLDLWQC